MKSRKSEKNSFSQNPSLIKTPRFSQKILPLSLTTPSQNYKFKKSKKKMKIKRWNKEKLIKKD